MKSISEERGRITSQILDVPIPDAAVSSGAEESDLINVATALAKRKWFLLKLFLACGVIGGTIAFLMPKWYRAEVLILPPQQNQSSATALLNSLAGNLGPLAGLAGVNVKTPSELYVGMLKSRPIADAMIRRFDLQTTYHAKTMTDARKALASETDIVAQKEGMISITMEDKDQKRVASMANAYVEELRNLTKNLAISEASQRRLFYEDQLKQSKDDLAGAEIALQQAQEKSGVIQLDAQAKAMIEGIGDLRGRIAAQQVEVQALRSYATEQNAQLNIAEQELAGMQSELRRLEQQNGSSAFDLALKNLPEAGLAYIRAMREFKYRETLYEILAKQYEIARLDEARDAAIIQVVSPAVEPDRKSFPPRGVLAVLSALGGLFVGCLIVIAGQWKARLQADPRRAEQLKSLRSAIFSK